MQETARNRWVGTGSYQLYLARIFALVTLCAVPISTAGVNLGSGLVLLFAILSPEVWKTLRQLATSPTTIAALLLLAALALSMTYTTASRDEALNFLLKYRKLIFLPVLFLVFYGSYETRWSKAAIWALFATLTLAMVLTYTNFFGLTAVGPMHGNDPITKPWVFKDHISGGLMMAYLAFLSTALARDASSRTARWLLYLVALLALINVLFVLQGRTGQVVAIAYIVGYAIAQVVIFKHPTNRTRWIAAIVSVAVCLSIVAYFLTSKHSRFAETTTEISQFEVDNINTSSGVRLEFYRRSLELIVHRPIAGYGVGSVRNEFEAFAKNNTGGRAVMASNPHNEYLLMGVQIGLIGVALFVWLLYVVYRDGKRLDKLERIAVYGYLFAFFLGCFANSLLLNFTEGNLFVFLTGILIAGRSQKVGENTGRKASAYP
jgi:O-antigen ligase